MIQRIQSIYLVLTLILGVLCYFIPYTIFYLNGNHVADITAVGIVFKPEAIITAQINMMLLTINIGLIAALSFLTIFLFKKRRIQMLLIKINMVCVIISVVAMFLYVDIIKTAINAETKYFFGAAFPILSLIFLYLALRAINKDENLVKAADRLR